MKTSTPKNVNSIKSRPSIHYPPGEGAIAVSPIESKKNAQQQEEELEQPEPAISSDESDAEEGTDDDADNDAEMPSQMRNYEAERNNDNDDTDKSFVIQNVFKRFPKYCRGAVIAVIVGLVLSYKFILTHEETFLNKLNDIRDEYRSQSDDLWIYIESSIREVKTFNKPSVLLFVHEQKGEDTVERMLHNISKYANCVISDCNIPPITLTHEDLSRQIFLRDFGKVISRYKSELENKHVMIVKNLDLVPSEVAQAFHTFCDEITPLVRRSLFIFTVSVYSFEERGMEQVTKILHSKWQNLGTDKLEPLITRVTSVVQRIRSEQV